MWLLLRATLSSDRNKLCDERGDRTLLQYDAYFYERINMPASFSVQNMMKEQVINTMNEKYAEMEVKSAVFFMNTNKAECNAAAIAEQVKKICKPYGMNVCALITSKGPERDIDREEINKLIAVIMQEQFEIVVVKDMTDLTNNLDDLEEFMKDAAGQGIRFFELSTMCIRYNDYEEEY